MNTIPDLTKRLISARENLRWTQDDLARATKLHPTAISMFERGDRTPNLQNLLKLASALRVSTDWLLGFSPNSKRPEVVINGVRYLPEPPKPDSSGQECPRSSLAI